MISRTLGAPFGGTTRGGHQGLDCSASSLITPPNFGGGGGSCSPGMVVVALGEPRVPVTCCARAGFAPIMSAPKRNVTVIAIRASFMVRTSQLRTSMLRKRLMALPAAQSPRPTPVRRRRRTQASIYLYTSRNSEKRCYSMDLALKHRAFPPQLSFQVKGRFLVFSFAHVERKTRWLRRQSPWSVPPC